MANTLIVDGNSLGHANHNATKLTVGEMETQAIFGTTKSIQKLALAYPGWQIIVLWDGKAQFRFDLLPEYKGTRVAKNDKEQQSKDSYKRQVPFIRKALQLMGVRQMLVTSLEADDLAGILSKRLSSAGNQVVLVSGDKDWLQLINPNVLWFDPIRDRRCGHGGFFEFTGYRTPEQFVDGKALMGDGSDNISGVGGIGEKGAPEFIAEFGSVEKFFEMCDSGAFKPKKKAHINLCSSITPEDWEKAYSGDPENEDAHKKHTAAWPGQGRILFRRNRKLMNLLDVPNPKKEDVTLIAPTLNREVFKSLCEKLAFHSILRDLDTFLKPFEQPVALAA